MTKMPTTNTSGRTIVITGWGWKEYAVAAAVALRALGAATDVMGNLGRDPVRDEILGWFLVDFGR